MLVETCSGSWSRLPRAPKSGTGELRVIAESPRARGRVGCSVEVLDWLLLLLVQLVSMYGYREKNTSSELPNDR